MSAGWTGRFLDIDPARYGLIVPPRIAGELQYTNATIPGWTTNDRFDDPRPNKPFGTLPRDQAHFRGLYLHGRRVVVSYSVGKRSVLESPWAELVDGVPLLTRTVEISPGANRCSMLVCGDEGVAALVGPPVEGVTLRSRRGSDTAATVVIDRNDQPVVFQVAVVSRRLADEKRLGELVAGIAAPTSLTRLTAPGPLRWTEPITTRGTSEKAPGIFAIDTLTLPFENPYRALFFVSGHDFFANGDAAVCTVHGDVWRVSGIDDSLNQIRWKRFATGLFQPLGLKVVKEQVYVIGRDQLTRLHDFNSDGEADFFENINNEGHVSPNGHEYVTCLETDHEGNFYFLKGDSGSRTLHDGCMLRVPPDGSRLDIFATGLRNANGLSIGPHDEITAAPQEGEWTPASGLFRVKHGGFYGAMQVHHRAMAPTTLDLPLCWLPRRVDNSSGGQVWIPAGSWGELGGHMLHLSYGQCTMMLVLEEQTKKILQGGVVPFPIQFRSGVMRGRFHPGDGHLYLSGLRGWASNAALDGCFQRVRYVGGADPIPIKMKTYANGMAMTFTHSLDRETAEDPDNYALEQWNYRWSSQYGSPELKPSQPQVEGREKVHIESVSMLADGRTVFLEISNLQPVSVLAIRCQLMPNDVKGDPSFLYATLHDVPSESMSLGGLSRRRSRSQLSEAERIRLTPGLVVRFEQRLGERVLHDVTRRRMAVIDVAADAPPTSTLGSGPFRAVFEGYLRIPEPGAYRLRSVGTGTARVFLNGERIDALTIGTPATRNFSSGSAEQQLRGDMRLRIEYEHSLPHERAAFQLFWQPPAGWEEPIPPTVFWGVTADDEVAAETKRRGLAAIAQHRCAKCHRDESTTEKTGGAAVDDGPGLADIGSRVNRRWLAQWLLAPDSLRNDTFMPRLLGEASSEKARQRASHLAEFLSTLKVTKKNPLQQAPGNGDVSTGARLWEELGCIGCHRLNSPTVEDPYHRVSLHFVAAKFTRAGLGDYLMRPHTYHAASRMPDFKLAELEASALSAYLVAHTQSNPDDGLQLPPGDAAEGRKFAVELKCVNCHDFGSALPRDKLSYARTSLGSGTRAEHGCLSEAAPADTSSPGFRVSPERRRDLQTGWLSAREGKQQACAAEQAERLFQELRCGVCHGRDDRANRLPSILAEESDLGLIPESLPDLTWAGDKLNGKWMEDFIAGRIPNRPRPNLKARMPAFPAYAQVLSQGFSAQHGAGTRLPSLHGLTVDGDRRAPQDDLLRTGYWLTRKDSGLDCRQCHGIGHEQPQGDERARVAFGIDFTQVRQRMRYDFYRRFVLDPPRYDVNSKMPKLSADGKSTQVKQILDGDASRQFDAIWQYIQTLHSDEP